MVGVGVVVAVLVVDVAVEVDLFFNLISKMAKEPEGIISKGVCMKIRRPNQAEFPLISTGSHNSCSTSINLLFGEYKERERPASKIAEEEDLEVILEKSFGSMERVSIQKVI